MDGMQKGSGKGAGKADQQADGVPVPFITLSNKGLGWKASQSRLFLKIPGIKANKAKYFYF
jgi:hypothetical protein